MGKSPVEDATFQEVADSFVEVNPLMLESLRRRQQQPAEVVRTFLQSWNEASRDEGGGQGLALGWYILLAGLTGSGKTLLALNLVAEALRNGVNVLFFSLEMSWEQLVTRLRAIATGREVTRVEWGHYYSPLEAEAADQEILGLPGKLILNRDPVWRLRDIRQVMEMHRHEADVTLFVVDYAQLVEPSGSDRKMYEAMSSISSQLRFQAKKLGAVTVAISQLNRAATADRKARPTVDGLFGSSRFGFDADQVLILDHTRRQANTYARTEDTFLRLAKNRHGPAIDIPVRLEKRTLRIQEIQEVSEDREASHATG